MQRENLNIIADPKGLIYGDITLSTRRGRSSAASKESRA